jgi:hypothetical protein
LRWGVVFPWAYLFSAAVALYRGGSVYWDNAFEVAARAAEDRHEDTTQTLCNS